MKNILLIGPPPSAKGGVTIWMRIVLEYLKSNNPKDLNIVHLAIERSVSLTHLLPTYKRLYYSIKDYTRGLSNLVIALKKGRYDKVHMVSSLGAGIVRDWLYVNIIKYLKVEPIVHYHCGTLQNVLKGTGCSKKLLLSTLKKSYKSIVLDEASYKAIKGYGLENVVKIGNSFNQEIEELAKIDIERKFNKILFVGHNVREKGIFELVEACSTIENITLDIYGPQDALIHSSLNQWINKNGFKGQINFKGLQPQVNIYKAMRGAGLFVLPTYTEGFPYVIVEAMASGCPIITTPVGAIKEMLTYKGNVQGMLVDPKDSTSLREKVMYCLNNYNEVEEMAKKAKEKAYEEYSTEAIMNRFVNLWKE